MHSKSPTLRELAASVGVSPRTLSNWRIEGVDIQDSTALAKRAAIMHRRTEAGEDLAQAKLRKATADADRAETRAAFEKGQLVPVAGIRESGRAAGQAVRHAFEKLAAGLPPLVAGRSAAEVAQILRSEIRKALATLAESPAFSPLTISTE